MEHDLFQSKLKPLVDVALLSEMIRSSSSGEHPHRAAAMELIFKGSIRERHERMLMRAKNTLRPDPAPRPTEESKDVPNISIPVQLAAPPSAPQPQTHSPPNNVGTSLPAGLVSASVESEASLSSSTLSRPGKKKGARCDPEPPTGPEVDSPPLEDAVELLCQCCHMKQPRGRSGWVSAVARAIAA